MKKIWEKIKHVADDSYQLFIIIFVTLIMIGGLAFQSSSHKAQINQLNKVNGGKLEIYQQEYKNIKAAGDNLFQIYSREKANSQLQEEIIKRQQLIIEKIMKELNEYRKWDNIDPNSIT